MQNQTVREAAIQHMASNKLKAAAAVLEKHISENETKQTDKDATRYAIDTFELDTALRRGMEKLEYLREIRANTEESRIKAVASSAVNREFREQSSWWLPKQELPDSWFPTPPSSAPGKPSNSNRPPRPVSPKHPPPATPVAPSRGRPSSTAPLAALGISEVDVAMALGDTDAAGAAAAAAKNTGDLSPRRLAHTSTGSVGGSRAARVSLSGGSSRQLMAAAAAASAGAAGPGSPSAASASGRVAWALNSRKNLTVSGGDILPGKAPVLYDGGGDEAVPGAGPAGPMQPPPGYPRYTVNLFQRQKQQQQRQPDADQPQEGQGQVSRELLVVQSDDEEHDASGSGSDVGNIVVGGGGSWDPDGGGSAAAVGQQPLGTGFRALAEEEPHAGFQRVALSMAINSAAARVAASNAEARGVGATFGMVGSVGAAPGPEVTPPTPRSNSSRVLRSRQPPASQPPPPLHGSDSQPLDAAVPEPLVMHQSSPLVLGLRASAAPPPPDTLRSSSPGVVDVSNLNSNGVADVASPALASATSVGTAGLVPTPPSSALETRTSSSLRLGRPQPLYRNIIHSESANQRGSAPASPQPLRVALSGFSGRLRLGTASASGSLGGDGSTEGSPMQSSGGAAGTPTAGAAALRARLRLLAVPGEDDGSGGGAATAGRLSSPGGATAPFARSLLAPASPAGFGPGSGGGGGGGGHALDSPMHSAQAAMLSARFSERSLLAGGTSATSLDTPRSAAAAAAGPGGPDGDAAEATSPLEGAASASGPVATPPQLALSRTMSRRRMGVPTPATATGDSSPAGQESPSPPPLRAHPPPPPLQPQRQYSQVSATSSNSEPLPAPLSQPLISELSPRPTALSPQASIRTAMSARRPSSSGTRASPLSSAGAAIGTGASPLSPQSPDHAAMLEPRSSSPGLAPPPTMSSPSFKSRSNSHGPFHHTHAQQLLRLPSRSHDTTLPPHFEQQNQLPPETILEEPDPDADLNVSAYADPSGGLDGPDARRRAVLGMAAQAQPQLTLPAALPSPRSGGGGSAALLPSPRPTSAHASGASGPPHGWRLPSGSSGPAAEQAAESLGLVTASPGQPGRDTPPRLTTSASSRARRSSMPSGQAEPSPLPLPLAARPSQAVRSTQPGMVALVEGVRPWETAATNNVSPRPTRGLSGSGAIPASGGGGGSISLSGGVPLMPTALSGRQQAGGLPPAAATAAAAQARSVSVSGGLPLAPTGAIGSGGGLRTMSATGTPLVGGPRLSLSGHTEEAPSSPDSPPGNEYRLAVGPMPTSRQGPSIVIKNTIDI